MTPFEMLKLVAAAWYIAYAVTSTAGPFGVFERVRDWRDGRWHGRTMGWHIEHKEQVPMSDGLLDCIICLAPWVALILRLIGANIITDAFAIAGIALLLHGYTGWRHTIS